MAVEGCLTTAHTADETALADAITAINKCHLDFAALIAPGGDLAVMEASVRTYQNSLNGLQDDVDTKVEMRLDSKAL